jgi:hypothetical protein
MSSVVVLSVLVQVFGGFERVTAHGAFLMSHCHMLAETSWRIKAEFTRDTFEMLCCRHTAGNARMALRFVTVVSPPLQKDNSTQSLLQIARKR